jgi:hypothetical protein
MYELLQGDRAMTATLRPETIEYLKGIGLTTHAGRGRRKNRPMGRARIFLKDMDVGDVHMPANIGEDAPRRRPRKYPALSLARPEPNMTPAQAYVQKHFFSAKRRRKLAATGAAMPGGSFPIEAPKDVHNAMALLHHHDTPAVRAHIKSRAQALGMGDPFQKDWTQFDQERGAGEKTGRVAGLGAGLYATPRVARIVGRVMISRGFKRFPALGAGAIAAYGTVRGAQAAGGYVGRKIDELAGKVFKDWSEWDANHQHDSRGRPLTHQEVEAQHRDGLLTRAEADKAHQSIPGRKMMGSMPYSPERAALNRRVNAKLAAVKPKGPRAPLGTRVARGVAYGSALGGSIGLAGGGAKGAVSGMIAGGALGALHQSLFGKGSIEQTMGEFKRGKLHSGSKKGPQVTDRAQAIAIALDTARREGLRT